MTQANKDSIANLLRQLDKILIGCRIGRPDLRPSADNLRAAIAEALALLEQKPPARRGCVTRRGREPQPVSAAEFQRFLANRPGWRGVALEDLVAEFTKRKAGLLWNNSAK